MTSSFRVVILSNVPEVAAMLSTTVTRLGSDPVAVVAAKRRKPTPGLTSIDASTELKGTQVIIVPERGSMEPTLRSLQPDVLLSWAFPWLVPEAALALPSLGAINYHPSVLPRHRGSNPVAWTIRRGIPITGSVGTGCLPSTTAGRFWLKDRRRPRRGHDLRRRSQDYHPRASHVARRIRASH